MKKYTPYILFILIVGFMVTLKLLSEREEKIPLWEYVLSEDGESYLIKAYNGDEESLTIKETYKEKPIIGFDPDFVMPFEVKELKLSINFEQLNLENSYSLIVDSLIIPEDSKLKSISCSTRFDKSSIEIMYVPKDTVLCVNSFFENTTIKEFEVHSDNPFYSTQDGILFNKDLTELLFFPPRHEFTEYTIPSSVTSILYGAFFEQKTLDSLYIPETVTSIGDYAFSYSSLETVTFSPLTTITHFGDHIFSYTYNLKHFDVPDSITELNSTFAYSSIESVTFGEDSQLTTLGYSAFRSTSRLKELTLPKNLTTIRQSPFDGSGIEVLTFTSDLIDFYPEIFDGIRNLETINFLVKQSKLSFQNGIMKRDEGKEIILYIPESEDSTTFYIDEYVETIHYSVINYRANIMNFEVDENNTTLKAIDGVVYSNDLTTLLYYPYSNTNISYEVIDGTIEIASTFRSGSNLLAIILPESLEVINSSAFSMSQIESVMFLGESKLETIPMGAFRNSRLKEIVIPKSVKVIGSSAFEGTPLEKLEFEDESLLETIEREAFKDTLFRTLILPPRDLTIQEEAFYSDYLKYVYIPIEVTSLAENVFNHRIEMTFLLEESMLIEELNLTSSKFTFLYDQTIESFLIEIEE